MTYPKVSIVIVTYNTKDLIQRCLDHLASNLRDCEIIVVDNGSIDGTYHLLKKNYPKVKLYRTETNLGFGGANNIGFSYARGEYVILLNSDAFPHPGAIEKAIQLMDENPKVGLGGARLISEDGSWQPSARMFPSILNDFLTLAGLAEKYLESRFV